MLYFVNQGVKDERGFLVRKFPLRNNYVAVKF